MYLTSTISSSFNP